RRPRLYQLLYLPLAALPLLGFLGYYQYVTNGSPWTTGYQIFAPWYRPPLLDFSSPERWAGIWQDLERIFKQMRLTQRYPCGWPTLSRWGVFLLYLFRKQCRYTNIVLAAVGGQYLGYMFMFQD